MSSPDLVTSCNEVLLPIINTHYIPYRNNQRNINQSSDDELPDLDINLSPSTSAPNKNRKPQALSTKVDEEKLTEPKLVINSFHAVCVLVLFFLSFLLNSVLFFPTRHDSRNEKRISNVSSLNLLRKQGKG